MKLKEVLERNHIYAGDKQHTHTQRGGRLIKEVINHREQCQRAITLPLSKHCSHSALLAGVQLSPRLEILASSLKIITKITLRLPEVPGQLQETLSSWEAILIDRITI